jgi:7,8-dihydro-6-hydroxymethylpterin dimethyltransferase
MVELTIEITNYCPQECDFCSSDASSIGSYLPFNDIKRFLFAYNEIDRINISGGEPLSHPDFYKILILCKSITSNVWVYTNAIQNIAYNAHVLTELNVAANVCLVPGEAVYMPKGSFSVHVLKFVPQGRGANIPEVPLSFSGNCEGEKCKTCVQPTLKADGSIAVTPCKKVKI